MFRYVSGGGGRVSDCSCSYLQVPDSNPGRSFLCFYYNMVLLATPVKPPVLMSREKDFINIGT